MTKHNYENCNVIFDPLRAIFFTWSQVYLINNYSMQQYAVQHMYCLRAHVTCRSCQGVSLPYNQMAPLVTVLTKFQDSNIISYTRRIISVLLTDNY